ncbi:conserved hypothetical protein [Paenibacillus curdlanolyticus YK9]|uniref:Uncharacterized protein n=1 Tax=Paenibacillus curdlanolyticus YK9 TaxID=717606 RepID=E0ICV6_9BACL|nr:hypothetical protein [Paenibacillus curdlanolyticus]EFM09671.1 conserved hypothetical protein [Paenibacillus curdlanolyticus YK9]
MNRKRKYGIITFLFVLIVITLLVNNPMEASDKSNKEYSVVSAEAKILNFDNIANLEGYSDYIVIGHVAGEQSMHDVKTDEGVVVDQLGQTPFQIDRVIKGDLSKDTTITVYEDGYVQNEKYVTLEGYVKMKKQAQILLFLRKAGDNTFAINGSYQGKYNVDKKSVEKAFTANAITDADLDQYDYIGNEVEHFNKLKEEALNKFIK